MSGFQSCLIYVHFKNMSVASYFQQLPLPLTFNVFFDGMPHTAHRLQRCSGLWTTIMVQLFGFSAYLLQNSVVVVPTNVLTKLQFCQYDKNTDPKISSFTWFLLSLITNLLLFLSKYNKITSHKKSMHECIHTQAYRRKYRVGQKLDCF